MTDNDLPSTPAAGVTGIELWQGDSKSNAMAMRRAETLAPLRHWR